MTRDNVALVVDDEPFTESEVLVGALIAGSADDLLNGLADGLASLSLAEELGEEASQAELQAALDAWRIERDLVSAEEFESWLASEELDLEDVASHLERAILKERVHSALEGKLGQRRPALPELLRLLPVAAAIEGVGPALAEEFALRAVAPAPDRASAEDVEAERQRVMLRLGCMGLEMLKTVLAPLGIADNRLRALVDREVAFSFLRADLGRDDVVAQVLCDDRDALLSFELADVWFSDLDVAREVICCVREDRDPLPRAAGRAGQDCRRRLVAAATLEDSPYRHRLPSSRARDVLGPYAVGGRHLVVQVLRRVEPDLTSERVRTSALDRIVRRALGRDVLDRVRFTRRGAA